MKTSENRHPCRLVAAAVLSASLLAPAAAQVTQRVSLGFGGVQGNNDSHDASISSDGRFVAFGSYASNLVPGDTNGFLDVFVHDRQSGATERASLGSAGTQGDSGSFDPSISADGRYVAFLSTATNLVPGDTNGFQDVFVRDRQTGATERASLGAAGAEGDESSHEPSISADGRYVAFWSYASNLVPGDTNGSADVFVRDRQTGATERVSVGSAGAQANGPSVSDDPSISADGRFVVFYSAATDVVPGDTNGFQDVFVRDRLSGTTARMSLGPAGAQGNGMSGYPSISPDGRFVAFRSLASNLVPGDTNGVGDVFVRERQRGPTERVSLDSAGAEGNGEAGSNSISISADGRYVAFYSAASNLVAGDTNGVTDVFVRDRLSGATERASVDSAGLEGNGASFRPSISSDGRWLAFDGLATNLVGGDTNAAYDVFVRELDESNAVAFCFPGIEGVRSCPCGNPATSPDRGCDNFVGASTTSGTGGARLDVSGIPRASAANTLVFHVTKAHNPPGDSNLHVLWRGASTLATGLKSGFGVRCVAGVLARAYEGAGAGTGGLGSTNAVDFPNAVQTTDAWTASLMPAAGTTLYYYDSYRDGQGPSACFSANDRFNVSHAVSITWIP